MRISVFLLLSFIYLLPYCVYADNADFFVIKVTNSMSVTKHSNCSDKPQWGSCRYDWIEVTDSIRHKPTEWIPDYYNYFPDIIPAKVTEKGDNISYAFKDGINISLTMSYRPRHFDGINTDYLNISEKGELNGKESYSVSESHHCGFHTDHVNITAKVIVDGPLRIKLDNSESRFSFADDPNGIAIKLYSTPLAMGNEYTLEYTDQLGDSSEYPWTQVQGYSGELLPGNTINVRYQDIFGRYYDDNYISHLSKPIRLRVHKRMVDGKDQYSDEIRVYYFKLAPSFSVESYTTTACQKEGTQPSPFTSMIVKLDNPNDDVFVGTDSKWKIGDDELNSKYLGNGRYALSTVSDKTYKIDENDQYTITLSGFTMEKEGDKPASLWSEDDTEYQSCSIKSIIDVPTQIGVKLTYPEKISVSQNTNLREYYGGYDLLGGDPYALLTIKDNCNRVPYSVDGLDFSRIPEGIDEETCKKNALESIENNDPSWVTHYRGQWFDDYFTNNILVKPLPTKPTLPTISNSTELSFMFDRQNIKLFYSARESDRTTTGYFYTCNLYASSANYFTINNIPDAVVKLWTDYTNYNVTAKPGDYWCYYSNWGINNSANEGFQVSVEGPTEIKYRKWEYYNNIKEGYLSLYYLTGGLSVKYINHGGSTLLIYSSWGYSLLHLGEPTRPEAQPSTEPIGYNYQLVSFNGTHKQSLISENGKYVAFLNDRNTLFYKNGSDIYKWDFDSDVTIEGVCEDGVYILTDGKYYMFNKDTKVEKDRESVLKEYLKDKIHYEELKDRYISRRWEIEKNKNGIRVPVDKANTKYTLNITDNDGCKSTCDVTVLMPDIANLFTFEVLKEPTSECANDGSVEVKLKDPNATKIQVYDEYKILHDLTPDKDRIIVSNLGVSSKIYFHIGDIITDEPLFTNCSSLFKSEFKRPIVSEYLYQSEAHNGILLIDNFDSEEYRLCNTSIVNEDKYFYNVPAGQYQAVIEHTETCISQPSDINVSYRELRFVSIDTIDANTIGGNGSATLQAAFYRNKEEIIDSPQFHYKIHIEANGKEYSSIDDDLYISSLPVGTYTATLFACDGNGNNISDHAISRLFTIGQPSADVDFISSINEEGEWRIQAYGDNKKLTLVDIGNNTVQFGDVLADSEYRILFAGGVLVDKIYRPSDIFIKSHEYTIPTCSGEETACKFVFDEKLSFNGKDEVSSVYNIMTSEPSVSFVATRNSEYISNVTSLAQSRAGWREVVSQKFKKDDIPVFRKVTPEWVVESKKDCYGGDAEILKIYNLEDVSNDKTYYCRVTFDEHSSYDKEITISDNSPFTIKGSALGHYKFELMYNDDCPSDAVIETELTEPEPLKLDFSITDAFCREKGSIEISNVSGGTIYPEMGADYAFVINDHGKDDVIDFIKSANADNLALYSLENTNDKMKSLEPGQYIIHVYDNHLCTSEFEAKINSYNKPSFKHSETFVTCKDREDGSVVFSDIELQNNRRLDYKARLTDNGPGKNPTIEKIEEKTRSVSLSKLKCLTRPEMQIVEDMTVRPEVPYVIEGLAAADYYIYIEDSEGCVSDPTEVTVPIVPPVILAVSEKNFDAEIPAFGGKGGCATFNVTGGTSSNGYTLYLEHDGNHETRSMSDKTSLTKRDFSEGTYTIYCQDNKYECASNTIVKTFRGPDRALDFDVDIKHAECKALIGSVEVKPIGGWGDYIYELQGIKSVNNTADSYTFNSLGNGTYTITVYDKKGASVKHDVKLMYELLEVEHTINEESCGFSNVTLNIKGGVAPYTTEFRDVETNGAVVSYPGLTDGSYVFHVCDSRGCVYNVIKDVKYNAVKIDNIENGFYDPETPEKSVLIPIISGGSGSYTYEWTRNNEVVGTDRILTEQKDGFYNLRVSDGSCSDMLMGEIRALDNIDLQIVSLKRETGVGKNDGAVQLRSQNNIENKAVTIIHNNSEVVLPVDKTNNTINISNLAPGKYYLFCKGEKDPKERAYFEVLPYVELSLSTKVVNNVSTKNSTDGNATCIVSGGVAPYVVTVDGNAVEIIGNTISVDGLKAKKDNIGFVPYIIQVTDSCNNKQFVEFTIKAPDDLMFTYKAEPAFCHGYSDGKVTITPQGGWGDYTYKRNDEPYDVVGTFAKMESKKYRFEVMDKYGVTYADSIFIPQPDPLVVTSVEQDSVKCFEYANGSVTVNLKGGNGGYSIKIQDSPDPFIEGTTISGLSALPYTFEVKDKLGCFVKNIKKEVFQPKKLVILQDTVINTTCSFDNGEIHLKITGGSLPYTYEWTENSLAMNTNKPVVKNLKQDGNYRVVVSDRYGCQDEYSRTIDHSFLPSIKKVVTDPISCKSYKDGIAYLADSLIVRGYPTADYHLLWHDGQTGLTAKNQAEGRWQVTLRDDNDCEVTYEYTIEAPDTLTIIEDSAKHRDALCYGYSDGEITVIPQGGNGGFIYSWSNGDSEPTAKELSAGTYTVKITDSKNCEAQAEYIITEPKMLTVNIGEDITICPGNSYTFSTDNYSTYDWKNSKGELLTKERQLTVSEEDTYSITVTNEKGCFAHDDVKLSIGSDALKTDFFMTSMATTNDTIVAIEMSNMPVDYMKWEYDSDAFERLTELEDESYIINLKPGQTGTFDITLWAFSGGCTSLATHTLIVEEGEDNVDDISVRYEPYIKAFSVTPNHSDGLVNVYVELKEKLPADLIVYDIADGRKVQMKSLDGDSRYFAQFDLSLEHKGIYIVTLKAMSEKDDAKILLK